MHNILHAAVRAKHSAHQEYTSPLQVRSSACRGPDATCGIAPGRLSAPLHFVAKRLPHTGGARLSTHMIADELQRRYAHFLLKTAEHAHERGGEACFKPRCAPGRHPGAPCPPRLLGPRRSQAKLHTQPAPALLQRPGHWGQGCGLAPRCPRPCSRPGGAQARVRPPHPQRVPTHGNV